MQRRGKPISAPESVQIAEPEPSLEKLPRLPAVAPLEHLDLSKVDRHGADLESLVTKSLEVQAVRIEQLAKILETITKQMSQTMETMLDSIQIVQDAWGQFDETAEKLGNVTSALIRLYQVEDDRTS